MIIKKSQKINIIFLFSFLAFFVFNFLLISNVFAGEGANKALSGLDTTDPAITAPVVVKKSLRFMIEYKVSGLFLNRNV